MNEPSTKIDRSILWPALTVVFFLALSYFVSHILSRQAVLRDRETLNSYVSEVASGLSSIMNQRLQLTQSLAAYAKVNQDMTEEQFEEFALGAMGNLEGIRSLQLAPNAVVKFVTNKSENAKGHRS